MEVATLRVCVSKDIANAGRFLEVFLHLHFFMQGLLTHWQKMTAHCQDLEAVKLALSLSRFCVPVKWEFPDLIWRAQISLRPTNEQRALWEKRARLTAQTGKCGTGTTMFSSVCKTLFLSFFFLFQTNSLMQLLAWPASPNQSCPPTSPLQGQDLLLLAGSRAECLWGLCLDDLSAM